MFGSRGRREAEAAEAARVANVRTQFDATLGKLRGEMQTARDGGDELLENTKKLVADGVAELRRLHRGAGGSYHNLGDALEKELSRMNAEGRNAHARMKSRRVVRDNWKVLQDRSSLGTSGRKMLKAYGTLSEEWFQPYISELEIDLSRTRDEIAAELTVWFNTRWVNVATDPEAWEELRPLVADRWGDGSLAFYVGMGIELTLDAKEWDAATARHKQNPSLKDFIEPDPKLEDGELLHLAAKALRDRSFLEAKVVLAYSKHTGDYFRELGDVYRKDLADMIAEMEDGAMARQLKLTYLRA